MNVLLNCNSSTKLQFTEPGSRKLFIESSHTDVGHRHLITVTIFILCVCDHLTQALRCFYAVAGTQSLEK